MPKQIKIMYDYGGYMLWDEQGPLTGDELPISNALKQKIKTYSSLFDQTDPHEGAGIHLSKILHWGRLEVAKELQKELPDYKLEFWTPDTWMPNTEIFVGDIDWENKIESIFKKWTKELN